MINFVILSDWNSDSIPVQTLELLFKNSDAIIKIQTCKVGKKIIAEKYGQCPLCTWYFL